VHEDDAGDLAGPRFGEAEPGEDPRWLPLPRQRLEEQRRERAGPFQPIRLVDGRRAGQPAQGEDLGSPRVEVLGTCR
jgi:hypothetical protein